jgi:uncharacterized protein YdeI (YjbR/CyaY-like superfamily)
LKTEKPLVNKKYLLEKYPGKGGWTYAAIPEEFLLCLMDEPTAHKTFLSYTDGQQKEFIDWIYSAKTDDTKVERIAETLRKLAKQSKLRDK